MADSCIFCEWGKGGKENIWENDLFVSRLDSFPVSPGHSLIIPRKHVVDIANLTETEWKSLQKGIKEIIQIIEQTNLKIMYREMLKTTGSEISAWFCRKAIENPRINTRPDAYNHGVNDGRAAGRTVDHLHWHVIPRYEGDMIDPRGGVRYVIPEMGNYKISR